MVLAYAGLAAVALSPWPQLIGLAVLGINPVWSAIGADARQLWSLIGVIAMTAALAVATSATGRWQLLLGVLLTCALAAYSARLVRLGIHQAGAFTLMLAAYVMVDPGRAIDGIAATMPLWRLMLLIALVPGGCALWATVVTRLLGRGNLPTPRPVVADLPYGPLLGGLASVFLAICLIWFPGTEVWWVVLTLVCILRPTRAETATRERYRVYGTLLGGIGAGLIGWLVPHQPVWIVLGAIAIAVGTAINLNGGPYWKWSTLVTFAVVMLTFTPQTVLDGDLTRVAATLVGVSLTVGAMVFVDRCWPSLRH
ncbi:fusaric acid resistance family protein [Branchiibius hedensis]|uniref:Fusaric acid resistance protein-like n=1 Tax=Branchiibius hedensis TaxID=672460 RepID=A0A2Y8ZVD3_9MICO|nr:FUSC family protein [Branchiibius hedensis]PWJ25032.1 fusaric acid resistance family protein [Branchiibius hedensis]SSA33847.1 Fusaric acid resistance protein-like [Branchiibius hedensis]